MRGRKALAIKDLKQYDFDKLSKTQGNSREKAPRLAHIRNYKTFTEVAAAIRIKLRTLMNWVKRFKEQGIEELVDRAGRGAKPCISPEEKV